MFHFIKILLLVSGFTHCYVISDELDITLEKLHHEFNIHLAASGIA